MEITDDLKPCPFCGDDGEKGLQQVTMMNAERTVFNRVICRCCGAMAPELNWQARAAICACKYGDPLCPCQDDAQCHYEGSNPMQLAAGWQWVPVEPTEEMHAAAVRTVVRCSGNDDFPPRVWRAMLSAAPQPALPVPAGIGKGPIAWSVDDRLFWTLLEAQSHAVAEELPDDEIVPLSAGDIQIYGTAAAPQPGNASQQELRRAVRTSLYPWERPLCGARVAVDGNYTCNTCGKDWMGTPPPCVTPAQPVSAAAWRSMVEAAPQGQEKP